MYCFNLWKQTLMLFISVVFMAKTQYVNKAPQFFCAFSCSLGYKNPSANGAFTCPTPHVIPRTDKYGLSSVELTKGGSLKSEFSAYVSPASSVNTTSFTISLFVIENDNIYFGFIIVAIGKQSENTWVDLIQHSIANDILNTLTPSQSTVRNQVTNYAISSSTFFSNTSDLNYAVFMSSYSISTSNDGYPTIMDFSASTLSSVYTSVKVQVQAYVDLKLFKGFVLVYNTINMATDGAVYLHDFSTIKSTNVFDFQGNYAAWGARFNTKCIVGYHYFSFNLYEDYQLLLQYSAQSNYYALKNFGVNTANSIFKASIFCLSNGGYECDQNFPFYDSLTQGCYMSVDCPIPTSDPAILPTVPQLCTLCHVVDCIDCDSLSRSFCNQCNSSSHSTASFFGTCQCDTGYHRPSVSCVPNCTYYMQGCKLANCTNETCCNQCDVGYHLYSVSGCSQCKSCDLSIANCSQCSDQNLCTFCQPKFYIKSINNTNSICISCAATIPYCDLCSATISGLSCNSCQPGYINSLSSCTCSTVNLTGCVSCNIPTQCATCLPVYYLDPSTKQCQLCSSLFQCLDCSAYNNCTTCNQYYIPFFNSTDNSNLCVSCGQFLPNCYNCSSTSVCTLCDSGYGLTPLSRCQSCSSLHPHCVLCTDHTVCILCDQNSFTFMINSICVTCSDTVPQCSTCSLSGSQLVCSECPPGYFLDPVAQVCYLCSDYIDDCTQCRYNSATSKPECTECTSLFLVDDKFTCQKCKQGNFVTRTCSNVIGCSSSHVINGITICLSCDASSFFQYDKSTQKCVCQQGFEQQKSSQVCEQICGDGLTVNMACDDGNKVNGDGCSDQCTVEDKFECTTSLADPTSCILNEDISVVYDYTLRHMGENKLSMFFTVSPAYTAFNKVDWKKTISFNFSEPISCEFSYNDGILVITMEYTSDLDDKLMDLMINFDPSVINSESQSLSFKMGAVNGPLTFESDSNMAHYKVFNTTGLVIGVVCLTFYLVSSYFHKMIGLETIQFIQLVYFVRLISGSGVTSSFYAFNTLKYANGYNDVLSTSANSVEDFKSIPVSFVKLNLRLYFLENCNLMLIPVALATLAYFFYAFKKSRSHTLYNQTKEKIHKDRMVIQNRKLEWIYDSLIFSFTLSLLYLIFFSMLLTDLSVFQSKSLYSPLFIILSYAVSLTVLFVVSAIYCHEVISGVKKYQQMIDNQNVRSEEKSLEHDANGADHGFHPLYVSFYLVYQLVLIVVLSLVVFTKFSGVIEIVLVLSGMYLVIIVVWRPYKVKIHNNAIIGHQVIIVVFVLFQLLSKYKLIPAIIMTVFLYIILTAIFLTLILQLVRLFIHKKMSSKDSDQKNNPINLSNTQGLNKAQKGKILSNPFSYQNQIKNFQRQNFKPKHSFFSNQKFIDHIPPNDLASIKINAIKQKLKSEKLKQITQKGNKLMDDILQNDEHYELQVKKYRLRQQLNVFYGDQTPKAYQKL